MKVLNEHKQTWDKNMCFLSSIIITLNNVSVVTDNNLYFLFLHVENCLPAFFILFVDLLLKEALHHHLTVTT